jgi:hypothetical protein
MKRAGLIFVFYFLAFSFKAQDSTRTISHEVGFNIGTLLSQVKIFTVSPVQSPYLLFYNVYYKNLVGIRIGGGIFTSAFETEIEGQNNPRYTSSTNINLRAGVSYNFIQYKRLTCNLFGDYIYERGRLETSTTTTMQVFPDPKITQTVKSSTNIDGNGFQAGVGVKFNIYKNLFLYTEVPVTYLSEKIVSEDSIKETGEAELNTTTNSYQSGTRIALPNTIYLILRF